jgi:hypothetical protein
MRYPYAHSSMGRQRPNLGVSEFHLCILMHQPVSPFAIASITVAVFRSVTALQLSVALGARASVTYGHLLPAA